MGLVGLVPARRETCQSNSAGISPQFGRISLYIYMCVCSQCVSRRRAVEKLVSQMLKSLSEGNRQAGRNLYFELNDLRCIREYVKGSYVMAKTPSGSKSSPTWINRNLTAEELSAFDAEVPSIRSLMDSASVLIERGYRLTFGWDDKSNCSIACLFAPDDDDVNAGLAISARSKDAEEAWALLFYKHYVVLDELWGAAPLPPRQIRG